MFCLYIVLSLQIIKRQCEEIPPEALHEAVAEPCRLLVWTHSASPNAVSGTSLAVI